MLKIRSHLVLMALAILLPVMVFSAVALDLLRQGEREAALRGLHETVRATALLVDGELGSSVSALELLAASPYLESGDLGGFYEQASLLNKTSSSWCLLLDASGRQIMNTRLPFGSPLPAGDVLPTVREVVATQRPYTSNLMTATLDSQMVTTLYVPVRAEGGNRYVLAQSFAVDFFTKAAFSRATPPGWIVAVIDREGRFVARNQRSAELIGKPARPELVAAAKAATEGLIRHNTLEGIESYDAFTHSTVSGWTIAVAAPVDSIESSAGRAVAVASIGLLVAMAFAVTAAAFLGRRLVAAISKAAEAAAALGQGAIPQPTEYSVVELGQLHNALSEAGQILSSEQQSRMKAEAELERLLTNEYAARRRAEADNRAKDQFLAMLGHELRNPLAAIGGALAVGERRGHQSEAARDARAIIERQSRHLGRIVDDLLDVSRLASGKIVLETRPIDLAEVARSCFESLRATGRTAGYVMDINTEPAWVDGDATRLEQSISNLLVNALKFTAPGGTIGISVKAGADEAVLELKDTGVGISPELLPQVFDVFVQGPASQDRAQGGLGIGLALVRQLIGLHGGTVSAASPGPALGSTFTVRLPRIAQPEAAPVDPHRIPAPSAAPVALRLLLIEDNEDARRMLCELLELDGHEVFQASTATEGIKLATEHQPDVAVIDIGLAEMTGYEVARRLRSEPRCAYMGLIAMTGYGQEEDRKTALAAGFDRHVVKPADVEALLLTIAECAVTAARRRDLIPAES
ncbi:MAG: ATP-binding protein [Pseudomonadota bacterium]